MRYRFISAEDRKREEKQVNYDFSAWHSGHNLQFMAHNGQIHVICTDCGVASELEGISAKVSIQDSYKSQAEARITARTAIGKVSAGHSRDGVK
jgi:hypothetical protein